MTIDNLDEDKLDRLKSQLQTSGVAKDNQALFQVINQLIGAVKDINNEVIGIINGVVVDLDIKDLTFLTADDETPILPNSRELTAGFHITFDDTNPGQRVVNWATILPINLATDVTGRLALANLVQGSALSVLGVSGNATADHADIVAVSDGNVLRRSGTVVGFGAIDLANANAVTGRLLAANLFQGSALSVLGVTGNATADQASIAAASDSQVLRRSGTTLAFGAIDLSSANAVSNRLALANFVQGAALSILGVAGNATADYAGIAAAVDGNVLRRSGTTLGFGSLDLSVAGTVGTSRLALANIVQNAALSVLGVTGNAVADLAAIVAGTDGQVLRRSGTAVGFGALNLAAAAAITGLLPDANLSTNVPLKNGTNAFTGANSFATNPLDLLIGQIKFPSTANPSSNANTLDDYERNTFTPRLLVNTSPTGITYSTQKGWYIKIGNLVYVNIAITLSNKGASVGNVLVDQLPFSVLNDAAFFAPDLCSFTSFNVITYMGAVGLGGAAALALIKGGVGTTAIVQGTDLTNTSGFSCNVMYSI